MPARRTGLSDPRVLAAAAVTVVLWASAFIAIRSAGHSYGPGSMALLRMLIAAVLLGSYAAVRGIRWPPRRSWPLLAVWGATWFFGYNFTLNTAEQRIDAGTAAMVVNIAPLLVVVFAGLFLHEGFPRGLLIGAPVSFAGVVLIGMQSHSGHIEVLGLVLTVISAVLYAAATLMQKHLLRSVDSTTLTWLGVVVGAVVLLPWSGALLHDAAHAPLSATLQVIYLAVFPSAVAFSTWGYVLSRASAGQTSATTYIVPVVSIVMSWLLLGEAPTVAKLVGGALCLLGVGITRVMK